MTLNTFEVDTPALEQFLLRLLAARSYSTEEGDAAEVMRAELSRLGFDTDVDELGSVVGTLRLGAGPTVMLDCHLDTVPVVDPGEWSYKPEGEIVNGRVYGRGSVDMKGPLAACVHGIASLRGTGVGTVVVSGGVAEELVEGPAALHVAKRVRPDYVVICEPSQRTIARGQRGRAELVVEVQGRASHSAYPGSGINAVEVMADMIADLRTLVPPSHPVLGDGILVITDVKSEPYPSLSVVPERCTATFDRRTVLGETEDDVVAPVRSIVDRVCARWGTRGSVRIATQEFTTYTGMSIHVPNFAPAWLAAEEADIVTGAVTGLLSAGLDATVGHYKFCTNGSGTAGVLGIPTIGYGPGEEDQAHTVDESIALSDLHLGAQGFAAIISGLMKAGH
jgi:putative selenium metabolism hydrolase